MVSLFVAVKVVQDLAARWGFARDYLLPPSLPSRTLVLILASCLLATCIGPYTYHLYSVVFGYATSMFPYLHVGEFQALSFRTYTDFVQLLLTGFAFFALGRRKQLDLFLLLLLSAASGIHGSSAFPPRPAWRRYSVAQNAKSLRPVGKRRVSRPQSFC
jgi:hypothetical protein